MIGVLETFPVILSLIFKLFVESPQQVALFDRKTENKNSTTDHWVKTQEMFQKHTGRQSNLSYGGPIICGKLKRHSFPEELTCKAC